MSDGEAIMRSLQISVWDFSQMSASVNMKFSAIASIIHTDVFLCSKSQEIDPFGPNKVMECAPLAQLQHIFASSYL